MLSYQHIYHAANRADMLKHAVLQAVLKRYSRDTAPILYVETHAGRGRYDLTSPEARKGGEFHLGAERLLALDQIPRPLKDYAALVAEGADGKTLKTYPGSPAIAQHYLRAKDRVALFELHPGEHAALTEAVSGDTRMQIKKADGYRGALALQPRRGERLIAMLDPSYETMDDLEALIRWTPTALKRWPTAILMIWLPLFVDGREDEFGAFLSELERGGIAGARWPEDDSGSALAGSAMIVYRVEDALVAHITAIAAALEQVWAKAK